MSSLWVAVDHCKDSPTLPEYMHAKIIEKDKDATA